MLLSLFRKAGATGNVFFLRGGQTIDKGLAYSGIVGPFSTVAVVPTTPRVINFGPEALSKDKQSITVTGNISVSFDVAKAVSKFDFTVDIGSGSYVNPWETALETVIIEQAIAPVLVKAGELNVAEAVNSNKTFEEAIGAALRGNEALKTYGVNFVSCSITKIEPNDEEVAESIGAKEREAMLAEADSATHGRQMKGAKNDRAVKTYEAQTVQKIEQERAALLDLQGENKKKEALADAEATKIRLAPLKDVEAGKLLGAAIMDAAKSGRLGSLAITSEFLAAVGQK